MEMQLKMKLSKIRLLLLDVDGVLTDGNIIYNASGEEVKNFDAKDGLGLRLLIDAGIKVGIITGRTSKALKYRLSELNIDLIRDDVKNKAIALQEIVAKTGIKPEFVAFAGDDLIDISAMRRAGVAFCVPDAHQEVRSRADIITNAQGGKGAVREICEIILNAQGKWISILERFLG